MQSKPCTDHQQQCNCMSRSQSSRMTPINIPMNHMRMGLLRPLRPLKIYLHVLMQILPPSRSENSFEKLRQLLKRLNLLRGIFQAAARRHKDRSPTPLARSPLRQLPPELHTARAPHCPRAQLGPPEPNPRVRASQPPGPHPQISKFCLTS